MGSRISWTILAISKPRIPDFPRFRNFLYMGGRDSKSFLKFILIQTNTVIAIIRFNSINDKVWVHYTLPHFVVNHCGLQDIRLLHGWTLAGFELRGQASSGNSWYLPLSTPAQNTDLTCVPLPQSTEHCQLNGINLLCWHDIFDNPKERNKVCVLLHSDLFTPDVMHASFNSSVLLL